MVINNIFQSRSIYSLGKTVSFPFLELESAPDLTNVIATSSQTLHLSWTAPVTSNYTGEISYYQICYKKSSDFGTSNCSLASVRSNLTQAKIDGLHPYQDYAVRIRGVVAMGYGPYSNVLLATTDEAGEYNRNGPSMI